MKTYNLKINCKEELTEEQIEELIEIFDKIIKIPNVCSFRLEEE